MTNCAEINKQYLDQTVSQAVTFLLQAQDKGGWWKDFFTPAGVSDAWVTGFVGTTLAGIPDAGAKQAADATWQLLAHRETYEGGWGYHAKVPADADTTLWSLLLAEALGLGHEERCQQAYAFLARHVKSNGGVSTYEQESPIREYIGLPEGIISFQGWCGAHTCVTAAAACLPELSAQILPYLRQRQAADGRWCSYWWFEDEYCTARAATALALHGQSDSDRQQVEKAVVWAVERLQQLLSAKQPAAFAIAWCLQLLTLAKDLTSVRQICLEGVQHLIESQTADGSWQPSARLRVPRPDMVDPELVLNWQRWTGKFTGPPTLEKVLENTFNIFSLDQNGIFTTATALQALQRVSEFGFCKQ
jgi:squalene cyclase